jgi:hypothetical protein
MYYNQILIAFLKPLIVIGQYLIHIEHHDSITKPLCTGTIAFNLVDQNWSFNL